MYLNSMLRSIRSICFRGTTVSFLFVGLLFAGSVISVKAQAITEGFDAITTLPASGWFTQNNSVPLGTSGWFQGNPTTFPSHQGATNSYIGANFQNTTGGTGTISNWLLTPNRTFSNGDTITFFTRTTVPGTTQFPDRLQVRLSTNGASTNVGTGATAVGDFTILLLDINPTYGTAYPTAWTQFTITISGLSAPTSGRAAFRYFVENAGPTGVNSDFIGIDTFAYTPAAPPTNTQNVVDFDGDGRTDFAVIRNTGGGPSGQVTWFVNHNGPNTFTQAAWGVASDFFVPEDYDGDNKTDFAIWRPDAAGTAGFYILQSSNSTLRFEQFGQTGDDPTVVGDYDGDGSADAAVYRAGAAAGQQSTWFYRGTQGNPGGSVTYVPWGSHGDFPAPGDYDGNGLNDFVVQRNAGGGQARFIRMPTSPGFDTVYFGTPTDVIVPGDYDGDGKTDIAVVRGSGGQLHWFYEPSGTPGTVVQAVFGASATDFPTHGDYDGDGRTDFAVWRPNADPTQNFFWYFGSTSGLGVSEWGTSGDYPVANYNAH